MFITSEKERNAAVLAASEYLERERKRLLFYKKEKQRIQSQTQYVKPSVGIRFIKFSPEGDSFGLQTTIDLSTNAVIVGVFSDPQRKTPTLFLGHISGYRPYDFSHQFEKSFNTRGKPAKIFYEVLFGTGINSTDIRNIENRVRSFFQTSGIEYAKIPPEFQRKIKFRYKEPYKTLALLMEKQEEEKPGDYPFRVALISLVDS